MAGTAEDGGEILLGVGGAVGVGARPEFLESEACLVGTGGSGVGDVFAEDGECLPEGKGLEGEDNLCSGTFSHIADEGEVAAQEGFFEEVVGSGEGHGC